MFLGYDPIETKQEEDQVQGEKEDRYLIFGKLFFAVAPFLASYIEIGRSIFTGNIFRSCMQ